MENIKEKYHEVRKIETLKEMLNSSTELYGDRPAFHIKKEKGGVYQQIKYSQLKHEVDSLGTALLALGLENEKIAVIGENCYEWVVSYYAITNGTGVVVPLDKELSREEIYNLLSIADCKAIFFTQSYESYFTEFDIQYKFKMKVYGDRTDLSESLNIDENTDIIPGQIHLWEELIGMGEKRLENGDRSFVDAVIDPDEMKILLFTSGTTDVAKGVMLSHRNIASNVMDTCKIAYISPEDRSLSILPIHHTFESTMGMSLILYRGASTAFYEGLKYINKNIVESQTTVLICVPLIFESIYDKLWKQAEKTGKANTLRKAIQWNRRMKGFGINLSKKLFHSIHEKFGGKLRLLITGAAGINPNVLRGFEDLGFVMMQGYGLTECAPLVSGPPDFCDRYKKAGSVGPAVDCGEIKILDPDEDGIGEVIYKGSNVMLGYYNMPEKTAEVLKDGWFHTGDLGFLDKEGWLYIAGRKKNVIVTKTGKNIYPEELEDYINHNKYVQECLVHGMIENDGDDTQVSAQIRPDYDAIYEEFGTEFGEEEVQTLIKRAIHEINEKLPIYKRIRNISVRKDEFIKTTTKKIQRHKNV